MCNLYSFTKPQDAARRWLRVSRDRAGNVPPLPDIYPDQLAPIVHQDPDGERALEMMRWGFPPPPNMSKRPVTNVRNLASQYWRDWLRPEFRCVVPATAFCEYTDSTPKMPHWFGVADAAEPKPDPITYPAGSEAANRSFAERLLQLDSGRPLFAFAGIWRPWTGLRKGEEKEHRLFAILTTEPNDIVRPIHAKAMPVMLTTPEECDLWLSEAAPQALALQRPLPDALLTIFARGLKQESAELELPFL